MNDPIYLLLKSIERYGGNVFNVTLFTEYKDRFPDVGVFIQTLHILRELKLIETGKMISLTENGYQHLRHMEKNKS